jgi:hypothetical protein
MAGSKPWEGAYGDRKGVTMHPGPGMDKSLKVKLQTKDT